ncbi:MAG: hypothetical protein IPH20_01950 [Bacteroidales bacterium]|nr:hypothetical protein [Bacteroidales bacterium]
MTNLTNLFSRLTAVVAIILTLYLCTNTVKGQTYDIRDNWYMGPQICLVSFFGDLSVHDFDPVRKLTDESDFGLGLMAGKSINRLMDARINYIHGKMKGSNPGLDMNFKSNFDEISLGLTISLSRLILPFRISKIDLIAMAGIGYINYRSIKYSLSNGTYLSSEGYTKEKQAIGKASSSLTIPVGFELSYRISQNWIASGGFSFRLYYQDLLDSQIGSTGINDRYSVASIGLSHIFNPIKKKAYRNSFGCLDSF